MKWEDYAPSISGLPRGRWTEADVSKLLQSGLTPRGHRLDAPMPQYKMNAGDADAVAAYLASLPKPVRTAQGEDHEHSHEASEGHQH
jgi:hypothetical protein